MAVYCSFKKTAVFLICLTAIIVFVIGYYPFCKFKMLESEYDTSAGFREKTLDYIQRAEKYAKLMYLTKGKSFEITGHRGEKITVLLGWNNYVYIKKGNEEKKFAVKKIMDFYAKAPVLKRSGNSYWVDEKTRREFFGTELKNKDDRVYIYEQPDDLPFGNQKYGFVILVDNWTLMSGHINLFDY